MNKYLNSNYSAGSILERANYRKNEVKPYKVYGSIIERRMEKKKVSLWQKIKRRIIQK